MPAETELAVTGGGSASTRSTSQAAAEFLSGLLRDQFGIVPNGGARILDVGCGLGQIVTALRGAGFDAHGTDLPKALPVERPAYLVPIDVRTTSSRTVSYTLVGKYVLPFPDESFQAVISTSTIEHVQDKESFFAECLRVLSPGGVSAHVFPGKYYLPFDPHTKVPLVPALWPRVPRWWFTLWALAGRRNEHQRDKPWRLVASENVEYCSGSLSFWPIRRYRAALRALGYQDVRTAFPYYVDHAQGGYGRLLRRLGGSAVLSRLEPVLGEIRDVVLVARKQSIGTGAAAAARR